MPKKKQSQKGTIQIYLTSGRSINSWVQILCFSIQNKYHGVFLKPSNPNDRDASTFRQLYRAQDRLFIVLLGSSEKK